MNGKNFGVKIIPSLKNVTRNLQKLLCKFQLEHFPSNAQEFNLSPVEREFSLFLTSADIFLRKKNALVRQLVETQNFSPNSVK
jgi:hypothetical protein